MKKEKKKDYIGSVKIKHKGLWITLLVLFLLGCAAFAGINIYANALNITEIGEKYLSVYVKDIKLGILCYAATFVFSMLIFSLTSFILKRNLLKWESSATFLTSKTGFLGLNATLSFIITCALPYNLPRLIMLASNPTWFIHADPVFGKNIGYYVFQRPLFVETAKWTFLLLALILLYIIIVYFMYYARNGAGGIKVFLKQPQVVSHVGLVILAMYILSALSAGFSSEYMLLDNTLAKSNGGFTDIMVWSNFYKFLPFMVAIIVIASVVFLLKKRPAQLLYTLLSYPAVWLLVMIYALGVQSFYVTPNKATIERPYIKHRIEATNQAYGLDSVNEIIFTPNGKINASTVSENSEHIESLIVSDEQNALNMLNQLPGSKQFYLFKDADLVPTISGDKISAKYSAAREIFLPPENKTLNEYNNRKMRYTHGFGVGETAATAPEIPIIYDNQPAPGSEPRIYFGESEKDFKKDYIITGTGLGEFDGFTDETNYVYDGPAGVKLNLFTRILYAFRYQDPSILFSGNITEDSKILFNRNVIERAKIVLPFLSFDNDPYLVEAADGSLKWVLDGYTTTNNYPYAVKLYTIDEDFGTNYIRNSVKVTVDAYTGEVLAYITDWDDPIIRTVSNIYPEAFLTGPLPEEISSHLKYPETLFEMQSNIYKTYHDTNPAEFYTGENAWEYAMSKTGESSTVKSLTPYYQTLVNDIGNKELALISPFTLAGNSENLEAMLIAWSGSENYGNLTLYTFPKNTRIFGTMQVESRIESDKTVAEEIELLKSEGTVCYGPLTVLPVMDTICYIKPVYVNNGSLQLKRVMVICGETIALDSSLPAAFRKLSSLGPKTDYSFLPLTEEEPADEEFTTDEYNSLIISALDKYSEAKQFQTEGDWVNYGKAMEDFEYILDEIRYDINYPDEKTEE